MDLLFDITAGKAVILLPFLPGELRRSDISFTTNEGNLAHIFYSFYWQSDNDDGCFEY